MFTSLLLKEFKEKGWKIAACCVIGISISMLLLRLRIMEDLAAIRLVAIGYVFLLPLVFCSDIFSGEMSRRTICLLFKLPVERVKVFAAKYLFVIVAVTIICIVNAVLVEVIARGRQQYYFVLAGLFIHSLIAIVSIVSWFCAIGCICRNEAVSAVMLLCVYIGWGCVYLFANMYDHPWLMRFGPVSFNYETANLTNHIYWISYLAATVFPVLIAAYRYSRIRRFL
jgi:ABC-type transport system involved in multi-copper enzyme maturation permease subunit